MLYVSLARKYRPRTLDEMVNQRLIVKVLRSQLETDRPADSLLFVGPPGCGKTTTARLIGAALNCQRRKGQSPCGQCGSCEAIFTGKSLAVIEYDAGAMSGVEGVRQLRNASTFYSFGARYRVLILDEAHSMSRAAQNALLKTLEEPPSHLRFVLCSTAPSSLLPTVRSRCQIFNFTPISQDELVEFLGDIAQREQHDLTQPLLEQLALWSGGSVRDALHALEQVFGLGADATEADVQRLLRK